MKKQTKKCSHCKKTLPPLSEWREQQGGDPGELSKIFYKTYSIPCESCSFINFQVLSLKKLKIMETPKYRYPELYKVAMEISQKAGEMINKESAKVKSKATYKAQATLEYVVKILECAI